MNEQKGFIIRFGELIDEYRTDQRQAQDTPSQPGRLRRILRWFLPNGGTLLLAAALILTQQVWAKPLLSPASVPGPSATTVNYQGRLADSGGAPLDGTYGMTFALYDASTSGSLVWGPESHAAVPVSDGLFSVGLGSQTSGGIPTSAWNGDRYLEITMIRSHTGISPVTLSAMANNKVIRYNVDTVARLCAYLNCGVGDLFEYVPPEQGESCVSPDSDFNPD